MARSGLNLGSSGTGVRFCTVLPRSRRPRTSLQAAAEPAGAVRSAVWHSSSESLIWSIKGRLSRDAKRRGGARSRAQGAVALEACGATGRGVERRGTKTEVVSVVPILERSAERQLARAICR